MHISCSFVSLVLHIPRLLSLLTFLSCFSLSFNFYAVAILRLSMAGDLKVLIGQRGVVRKKVTESFN